MSIIPLPPLPLPAVGAGADGSTVGDEVIGVLILLDFIMAGLDALGPRFEESISFFTTGAASLGGPFGPGGVSTSSMSMGSTQRLPVLRSRLPLGPSPTGASLGGQLGAPGNVGRAEGMPVSRGVVVGASVPGVAVGASVPGVAVGASVGAGVPGVAVGASVTGGVGVGASVSPGSVGDADGMSDGESVAGTSVGSAGAAGQMNCDGVPRPLCR